MRRASGRAPALTGSARPGDDGRVSFVIDDRTHATSPARFRVSRRKWVEGTGQNALHRLWLWGVASLPDAVLARWRLLWRVPGMGKTMFLWLHAREVVATGALVPVMVVDYSRALCAAYTSLGASDDHVTPVVKVFGAPLWLLRPLPPNGQRFAAASSYSFPREDRPREGRPGDWSDVHPRILDLLCDDLAACIQARRRLAKSVWDELAAAVEELGPKAREPGLHYLDPARYVAWASSDVYVKPRR